MQTIGPRYIWIGRRRRWARLLSTAMAIALVAAACGADTAIDDPVDVAAPTSGAIADDGTVSTADDRVDPDADQPDSTDAPSPQPATPEPTPEPTAAPPPEPPTPEPTPTGDGPFDDLFAGDCWNNLGTELDAEPTEPIPCEGSHQYEVIARTEAPHGPDVPYPGVEALGDEMLDTFCAGAIFEFAGEAFDRLAMSTTVWMPTSDGWSIGDRTVLCTAGTALPDEATFKIGTAAGGTLDSDETIIARSSVDGQRDFYLSREAGPLYQVTHSQVELENASPDLVEGFVVYAGPLAETETTDLYSLNLRTDEFNPMANDALAGWELSSPAAAFDDQIVIVAGLPTPDADWDIYAVSESGVDQLTDDPGDDQWPTLLPDDSGIVWSSDGSLWIMNLDGSDKRQLTDNAGDDFESAVSPDGQTVVFASNRSGNDDIWSIAIDGTGLTNLTDHPAADAWPFWSADGSLVYWQTERLGVNAVIMMMNADGTNASWYSFEFMTNGQVVPDDLAEALIDELPPLGGPAGIEPSGDSEISIVEGDAGSLTTYPHTTGRLEVRLPAGWEVVETATDATAGLISAPSISGFRSSWAIDGVQIRLFDLPYDEWQQRIAETDATSCAELTRDSTTTEGPEGQPNLISTVEYDCGDASAWVVGVYNETAQAGLLFEGQFDGSPDETTDAALMVEISQGIGWS